MQDITRCIVDNLIVVLFIIFLLWKKIITIFYILQPMWEFVWRLKKNEGDSTPPPPALHHLNSFESIRLIRERYSRPLNKSNEWISTRSPSPPLKSDPLIPTYIDGPNRINLLWWYLVSSDVRVPSAFVASRSKVGARDELAPTTK